VAYTEAADAEVAANGANELPCDIGYVKRISVAFNMPNRAHFSVRERYQDQATIL
jgi:hypothetical protein